MHENVPAFDPEATVRTGLPVPQHVAIIMDGNGRWAEARGLPRSHGHRRGVEALRAVLRAAKVLGIKTLTLYSFSSENWSRPPSEVSDLMGLLKIFIRRDLAELCRENVRVRVIGGRDDLPADIVPLIEEAEAKTAANTGQNLVLAFNYGARDEIARAARRIAAASMRGEIDAATINPATVSAHLDTAEWPDPDLIIRTGGEKRLSNFLMFQAAYAELVFTDCFWPDFDAAALDRALAEFTSRNRRFGNVATAASGCEPDRAGGRVVQLAASG